MRTPTPTKGRARRANKRLDAQPEKTARERERERDAPMQSVHLQTDSIWAQRPTTTLDVVPEQLIRANSLTSPDPIPLLHKLPVALLQPAQETNPQQDLMYTIPHRLMSTIRT